MRKLSLVGLVATLAMVLAACSGTGTSKDTDSAKKLTFAVITHGQPGDAFWDRVKSGAEKARDDYGVTVKYSADPDPSKQAQLIAGAVADKVDGIAVTVANPDGVGPAIKKAVAAGIPVVTFNSGVEVYKSLGAITHVGQSEQIAGTAAGERLKALGWKNALCVNQDPGNTALEIRCAATAKAMGGKMANLQVDGTDDSQVTSTITSKLQADKSIDGVLTLGGQYALDAVSAVKSSGSSAQVATFDLSADVVKGIQDDTIQFAIDQQPYVQGFQSITVLYLKAINGNDVGGGEPVYSGPAFVTKENADAILKFAKNGTR